MSFGNASLINGMFNISLTRDVSLVSAIPTTGPGRNVLPCSVWLIFGLNTAYKGLSFNAFVR